MKRRYYILSLLPALLWTSCKHSEDVAPKQEQLSMTVNISGTFEMPEMMELDEDGSMRAFTLRRDEKGYPKIRLTGIEDNGAKYEAFPSTVWLHSGSRASNFRIDVEDYGQDPDRTVTSLNGATNKSNGPTADNRGVSRIIKKGDRYHVLISYEVTGKQGQPSHSTSGSENYPTTYADGTRAFAVFNHHRNDVSGQSIHRIYMPKVHNVKDNAPIPQLDDLKEVVGDYIVAEASHTKDITKAFKLPFMSNFANVSFIQSSRTAAATETKFYMAGALLVLKFRNGAKRPVTIKKIYTKSNNLAYTGFYEIWHSHGEGSTLPGDDKRPRFVRNESATTKSTELRNNIYPIGIKTESGGAYTLASGQTSTGAFYLWGGIDQSSQAGNRTTLQVEYFYGDTESTTNPARRTRTIDIAPKTAPNKFEEGKAYLITIPIE